MWAIFIRERQPDGSLSSWKFDDFVSCKNTESGALAEYAYIGKIFQTVVDEDKGQAWALNLRTGETQFKASPIDIPMLQRGVTKLQLSLWLHHPGQLVWGLTWGNVPIQMYSVEHAEPHNVIDKLGYEGDEQSLFYFSRYITAKKDDLIEGFKRLGIW